MTPPFLPEAGPLEAARAALPAFALWGPLWYVAFAALVALVTARVTASLALRPLRALGPEVHWTERARVAYAARLGGMYVPLFAAMMTGAGAVIVDGTLTRVSGGALIALSAVAAYGVGIAARARVERVVRGEPITAAAWLQGIASRAVVFFPHVWIAFALAVTLPASLDARAVGLLGAGVIAMAFAAIGGGLFVARAVGLARPASPRLNAVVARAAERAGTRAPPTYELAWHVANAAAFPWLGRLLFTSRAVERLTDDELLAVASHEIGHLTEPRSIALMRFGAASALLVPIAGATPLYAAGGWGAVLGALAVAIVALRVAQRVFRRMEERADAAAHAHEGDPGTYARALERLYEINAMPAVVAAKTVHPALYDRLVAVGATPSYPRPAPPARGPRLKALLPAILAPMLAVIGVNLAVMSAYDDATTEPELLDAIALRGGTAVDVGELGEKRHDRGDPEGALTFLRAASVLAADSVPYATRVAVVLAEARRCDEASAALGDASVRLARQRSDRALWRTVVAGATTQVHALCGGGPSAADDLDARE